MIELFAEFFKTWTFDGMSFMIGCVAMVIVGAIMSGR